MKKITFLSLLLLTTFYVHGQINAVTETGDAVILYESGQWAYVDDEPVELDSIFVNKKLFVKDEKATFLVKSKKVDSGIWINPKDWKFEGNGPSDVGEFSFNKKGSEIYGMLISEEIEVPIEALANIALINAKNVSPNAKITRQEYRNVNGRDILMMQISATIQGIDFQYFGYYYTTEIGSLQLLTWTYKEMFAEKEAEIEAFLNGLVEVQK